MEAKSEYEAHGIKQCSVPYTRGSNFQQEEISQINRNNKLAQLKDNDLHQSSLKYDQSFSTPRSVSDYSPFINWQVPLNHFNSKSYSQSQDHNSLSLRNTEYIGDPWSNSLEDSLQRTTQNKVKATGIDLNSQINIEQLEEI